MGERKEKVVGKSSSKKREKKMELRKRRKKKKGCITEIARKEKRIVKIYEKSVEQKGGI